MYVFYSLNFSVFFLLSLSLSEPIFRSQPTCWEAVRFNMLETLSLSAERVFLEKNTFPIMPREEWWMPLNSEKKSQTSVAFPGKGLVYDPSECVSLRTMWETQDARWENETQCV